ncbi:hypothetical protein MBM_03640 [Drepanopeziza brunnea f. sp. 'multigermtubi' MB_m1]|uniref:Uncharacterized protein n=1 Tax=Marssonina brunnea f. sp. multigermtubi (strain MB_m1) TaxID=1072389 RepID=K1XAW0_MARBU|nr:uncharacterized protein MBM_03640 [Drepanopeziza brunnea f. sp. 'multigermtubi' MB_m1]EKD17868.1 hypothetical protein MBM_03640 [Drepanopeziza brunnea f. sp. 'multigermtubi' MB_m1]
MARLGDRRVTDEACDYPELQGWPSRTYTSQGYHWICGRLYNTGISPPPQWNFVLFIAACSKKWPIWAERQRSNLRMANTKEKAEITMEFLIEDITLRKGR